MAREQIRSFLVRIGYEPILSEYSDILYDPRLHTHTSCIREVPNADLVILMIGSRFGGRGIPEALSTVDLENLAKASFDVSVLTEPEKLSITQLEVLKAIDSGVPVFAFVDDRVMHDYYVYQKNKDITDKIKFPSVEKMESAKYIFEFISFLLHRGTGNSVVTFSKIDDIETHLKKQWGALFQQLLREQREQTADARKMFTISEQIEDLKTAMMSTITNAATRDVARGVLKYRRLLDFLSGLAFGDPSTVTTSTCSFEGLLEKAGIVEVREIVAIRSSLGRSALLKADGTFYEMRYPQESLGRLSADWRSFSLLATQVRQVIFEAISDIGHIGPGIVRYRPERFDDVYEQEAKDTTEQQVRLGSIFGIGAIEDSQTDLIRLVGPSPVRAQSARISSASPRTLPPPLAAIPYAVSRAGACRSYRASHSSYASSDRSASGDDAFCRFAGLRMPTV
jgi:hypothetical protein